MVRNFLFAPFLEKYKVLWILKWNFAKQDDIMVRNWYVKWWDRFPCTQKLINTVNRDFPLAIPKYGSIEDFLNNFSIVKMVIQTPEYTAFQAPTTFDTSSKSKKKCVLQRLKNKDLLQLLKQSLQDEDNNDDESFKASSEASIDLHDFIFGHDLETTSRFSRD